MRETVAPVALLGGGLILIAVVLLTHGEFRRRPRAETSDLAEPAGPIPEPVPVASTEA